MSKFKLLTTPKVEGQTKTDIRKAAAAQNAGYRVANVADKGEEWQVRLEQLADDKLSSRRRQSAPPPAFLKEKDDKAEGSPEEEAAESPEEEAEEKSDTDKDEGKPEDDTDKGESGEKDPSKSEDPVKAIEGIMSDLNKLLGELGGHAQKLKEKADKVDEVHELTKGPDLVDDMGEVPPVPPIDDAAAIGPTPGGPPVGGPPVPPHRPGVPTGRAKKPPRPPVGVSTFTKRQTKIVEHPIKDDDGEYTLADFLAAIAADPQCEGYEVAEVKILKEANVYAGKLELAE